MAVSVPIVSVDAVESLEQGVSMVRSMSGRHGRQDSGMAVHKSEACMDRSVHRWPVVTKRFGHAHRNTVISDAIEWQQMYVVVSNTRQVCHATSEQLSSNATTINIQPASL